MAELSVVLPRGLPFSSTAHTFPLPSVTILTRGACKARSRVGRAFASLLLHPRARSLPAPPIDLQYYCHTIVVTPMYCHTNRIQSPKSYSSWGFTVMRLLICQKQLLNLLKAYLLKPYSYLRLFRFQNMPLKSYQPQIHTHLKSSPTTVVIVEF